jgi:NitT/TauT family transport system substrate-binding protein
LYIVETGDTVKSVSDLKGKTIYATGLGTTPQYTLNYVLKANGIDPDKDVKIEYKTEPTEVAAMLAKSDNAIAMLPQPYVTTVLMQNDKLRIALNLSEEWDKVSTDGSSVVTGVFVVRKDFLDNNKAAVDDFLTEYAKSTEFVNSNIEEASALVEQYDIFKAAVAKQAIPYCNITLLLGDDMKQKVTGYLKALFDQNPKSIGGKMPEDDFFYIP